jgi:predicted membrane channel-forming protein YqfA (hemolysin III family)
MSINLILLLVSAVFAIKARNLPDNFNECRFISYCALSTSLLWLAFLCSYFTTFTIYRALFLALIVFSNGVIMHGGLFLPKLYAVYFVQKKEVEPAEKSSSTKG